MSQVVGRYRPELDVHRFVAFLMVFLHLPCRAQAYLGWFGPTAATIGRGGHRHELRHQLSSSSSSAYLIDPVDLMEMEDGRTAISTCAGCGI